MIIAPFSSIYYGIVNLWLACTVSSFLAAPGDYNNSVILLTFGPGRTSQEVSVPIVDDNLLEAIETFFANLRFPAGGETFDSIQFAPSRANASITDNNCEYLIYMYACMHLTNPKGITDNLNLGPVQCYIKC